MADRIELTGLECFGYHGVFEEEKRTGQPFIVDITCWSEFAEAAATDDLTKTINYAELADVAAKIVEAARALRAPATRGGEPERGERRKTGPGGQVLDERTK